MKRLLLLFAAMPALMTMAQVQVQNLTTENLVNPIGLDITQPRFSWQLLSTKRNVMQTAYELKVATNPAIKGKDTWTTGKINSDLSVLIPYAGAPFNPAHVITGRYAYGITRAMPLPGVPRLVANSPAPSF
ncbi:hypothetical protein [Paraflavitalea speifideaquila]|uniref:glycoside hydrolase family 78 protein n=1 Tax=Paraflavitalea speifideaquila TaxID=3076558 RepID=UPI0028E5AD36|nr:hypothetical protein [Paraflavitalea speifideiaquila]